MTQIIFATELVVFIQKKHHYDTFLFSTRDEGEKNGIIQCGRTRLLHFDKIFFYLFSRLQNWLISSRYTCMVDS